MLTYYAAPNLLDHLSCWVYFYVSRVLFSSTKNIVSQLPEIKIHGKSTYLEQFPCFKIIIENLQMPIKIE